MRFRTSSTVVRRSMAEPLPLALTPRVLASRTARIEYELRRTAEI
jgi:hypothetical protein